MAPRRPTPSDRIRHLEDQADQLAATNTALIGKLDGILDRVRAVEATQVIQGAELSGHTEQIQKLTEISDSVVRLEERSRNGTDISQRFQVVQDDLKERLTRLESSVAAALPQTQKAAAGAAGVSTIAMVAVLKILEMAHIIPPGTMP